MPYYNANPDLTPVWDIAYTFLKEYSLPDMYPDTLANWIENSLGKNETEATKFRYNSNMGGPGSATSCSAGCRAGLVCGHNYPTNELSMNCSGA
jgi:hypothetical protein